MFVLTSSSIPENNTSAPWIKLLLEGAGISVSKFMFKSNVFDVKLFI